MRSFLSPKLHFLKACVCLLITLFGGITATAAKPNIVLVFTDDHGWADLGVHGVVDDIKTPHLDELARSGVRFNSGYITAPQCIPSRAGVLSGSYQQSFGVDDNRYSPMPTETLTLPERLKEAGYTTGMVGKWHLDPNVASQQWLEENTYAGRELPAMNQRKIPLSDLMPFKPYNQGFDEFFEGYIHNYWANFDLDANALKEEGERVQAEARDRLDIQTDAAMAFIERNYEDPFFLYLAYFAPHVPMESSEKYLSRFPGEMAERRRYALAMISAVDEGVGRIREQLRAKGQLDNTVFFFIGDNGAPLKITMEDVPISFRGGAWDGSLNTPFNGEKGMLSEGGIRVPYLLSWPNGIEPGQVSDLPVISLDVAATAVALAGLPRDAALAGENILQLMQDTSMASQRPLFWRFWRQAAIRVDDWKYLRAADDEFLFNLREDPSETQNLKDDYPKRLESLRTTWAAWNDTLERPFEGESGDLGQSEQQWYAHYFGVKPKSAPAVATGNQGQWLARHSELARTPRGLTLSHFQAGVNKAFITVNGLSVDSEALLRLNIASDVAGEGTVEIRYRGERRFNDDHSVDFKYDAGECSLSVRLPIRAGETLEHLRLVLPYQEDEVYIRRIDLLENERIIHQWAYVE